MWRARAGAQPRGAVGDGGVAGRRGTSRDVDERGWGVGVHTYRWYTLVSSPTPRTRVCLLPSHGLPHVAPRYEGRKSGARAIRRIDGISPLGSRSVTRSPANDSRGRCAPRGLLVIAGCRRSECVHPRVHRTDGRVEGRTISLNPGANGVNEEERSVWDTDRWWGGSKMLEQ